MTTNEPLRDLIGRSEDRGWLTALIHSAEKGRGSAAVLQGDAGVGKTFFVSTVLAENPHLRTLHTVGIESEADLPYGALQRLVLAHRSVLEDLVEAQQSALLVACGLRDAPPPTKSLIGLGLLNFLGRLARQDALIYFIDDAQWIDPESLQALAFVGRRLLADRITLIFAIRTGTFSSTVLTDFPSYTLPGLKREDAHKLLTATSRQKLSPKVAETIIDATGGNPLALVDLASDLTAKQLRGEALLPEPMPLGQHLEAHYLQQSSQLPQDAQTWLLAAAAEPDGNLDAITASARSLGLPENASRAAEVAGLVRVESTVRFRHPLVRSALYNGAPNHDVRVVHEHFAKVAELRGDTYRAVTHRAAATIGVDDDVAQALERAADLATARGGYASRMNLLMRSAALTSTAHSKHHRLLAAAESAIAAGATAQAGALIAVLDTDQLDDLGKGRLFMARCDLDTLDPVRGPIYVHRPLRLLTAARLFRTLDPTRAKHAIATSYWALVQADDMVQGTSSREIAEETRLICASNPTPDLLTEALTALSTLLIDGRAVAAPLVDAVIDRMQAPETHEDQVLQACASIAYAACLMGDPASRDAVIRRSEVIARKHGAVLVLCRVLLLGAYFDMQQGRVHVGQERLQRAADIIALMDLPKVWSDMVTSLPVLRGWRGDESVLEEDELDHETRVYGYGMSVASRFIAIMLLRAAQGRYSEAWDAGRRVRYEDPFFTGRLYLADLIECAARAGDHSAAAILLQDLQANNHNSRWAEGLVERSLAHIDEQDPAEHFERALELLTGPAVEMDAARTHLLYGEWLRRRRRRGAAARHLSEALMTFQRLGAPLWSERARRELASLGEVRDKNPAVPATTLTAQELSVARLAAAGHTNGDIAVQLFVSSNTVDYHLRKVFRKLSVTSRRQLQTINLQNQ